MARTAQQAARERARDAKRRMDADRAVLDRKIEEAATDYFAGDMLITEGRTATEDAVQTLVKVLAQSPADIAALLEVDEREVRRLLQTVRNREAVEGLAVSGTSDDEAGADIVSDAGDAGAADGSAA